MPLHESNPPSRTRLPRLLFWFSIFAQFALLVVFLRSDAGEGLSQVPPASPQAAALNRLTPDDFTLRHLFHHAAGQPGPRARRLDLTAERIAVASEDAQVGPFRIRTSPVKIERPANREFNAQIPMSPIWVAEDLEGPDVKDKETILNFAYMSEDAYKTGQDDPGWLDVDEQYNSSIPFGWDDSGIRGHVFGDSTNSTIILSLKGTTVAMFEGNGTSGHDKDNDNLFGSCCCGQGGAYLWRKVCDCKTGTYTCDEKCVKDELRKPSRYYEATLELYEEVVKIYPHASIITTGHSLGGVLASLIGLQHGLPSVTFETYPQALAARRLGLPTAGDVAPLRRFTGGFHFGHTADPVYMGTCNSGNSFCSIGGYAFETLCHTGKRCAYDVVKDWGWRPSTSTHSLKYAIDNVYKVYEEAAECVDEDVDCVDCFLWKFENGTHTTPITTSTVPSTTSTRTRTETCKTPGWWGCRDETSTSASAPITSITVTTTTTTTCETPGWFGCKDKTTTGNTTTTTSSSQSTTASCVTKGWFGKCLDTPATTSTMATEAYAYWRTAPATATASATSRC